MRLFVVLFSLAVFSVGCAAPYKLMKGCKPVQELDDSYACREP